MRDSLVEEQKGHTAATWGTTTQSMPSAIPNNPNLLLSLQHKHAHTFSRSLALSLSHSLTLCLSCIVLSRSTSTKTTTCCGAPAAQAGGEYAYISVSPFPEVRTKGKLAMNPLSFMTPRPVDVARAISMSSHRWNRCRYSTGSSDVDTRRPHSFSSCNTRSAGPTPPRCRRSVAAGASAGAPGAWGSSIQ